MSPRRQSQPADVEGELSKDGDWVEGRASGRQGLASGAVDHDAACPKMAVMPHKV